MLSLRNFWRRHRRKVLITTGVLGSGYILYKLYEAHQQRLADLEREAARERHNDEVIKSQMQEHFENIQRIAETTTLPHAVHYLSIRIAEELDLSQLTDRLMKGKGQSNTLSPSEKLELWDTLKIQSFTRMMVSIWSVTMLGLYIRVQVNILGRHFYIDLARHIGNSLSLDDADLIESEDEQKFLASSDFLASDSMEELILNMKAAVTEVLKQKQLRDNFHRLALHSTIMQILDTFMSTGSPHHWLDFLIPNDPRFRKACSSSENDGSPDYTKFDQLMVETREVLSSSEFSSIAEMSLKCVMDELVEEMSGLIAGGSSSLSSGIPLAKLLPRIAQICPSLVEEPSKNRFIQRIRSVTEVEHFFTLLYSNMGSSPS